MRFSQLNVLFAVAALLLSGCEGDDTAAAGERRGPPPTPVVVARVVEAPFLDTLQAVGTAASNESLEITANASDRIRRIAFREGQLVQAGEVLVELDTQQEEAELAEARANVADARRQLDRFESLVATNSAARAQRDEQAARVDATAARVDVIRARIADREVRAPFTGLLGMREVSPGALVGPEDRITTLDDISTIKLDFSVPENFFAALHAGALIRARTAAYPDQIFDGRVAYVSPRVDPVTRSVAIRADIPNDELLLRPGMLMTVDLVKDRRDGMMVPEAALIPQGERQFLFRVVDGAAERVEVRIGARRPGIVEIVDGLAPGETIVVEGGLRLRPGAPVSVSREIDALALVPDEARVDTLPGEDYYVRFEAAPLPAPAVLGAGGVGR